MWKLHQDTDGHQWLLSPEGEWVASFTDDTDTSRVIALLNVNIRRYDNSERLEYLKDFMDARAKAEAKLPKDEQVRLARKRLVDDGIYRVGSNGDLILHENYGGPPLGE